MVSLGTPVSAVRSTLFTHAEGPGMRSSDRPPPRDIWGPNSYLNEEGGVEDETLESERAWASETRFGLPKI